MIKQVITTILAIAIGAGGTIFYMDYMEQPLPEFCLKHEIEERECPWCDQSLIEKKGICTEHQVPEALCSRCNIKLIAGFKVENDWCAGHAIPESQCSRCKGGDLPPDEIQK